ncbi:MAG: PIG-L deacetylase family protein [Anaerolineales bacterium]
MQFIFLSPHFDDVVFSCGGLIWELRQQGNPVEIWTICGGKPELNHISPFASQLHKRWGVDKDAVSIRRKEDRIAAKILGVKRHLFSIPDCIYRHADDGTFYYLTEASLFGELDVREQATIDWLAREITRQISPGAQLIAPLAVGNHVDHQLTRLAAEIVDHHLWYYADVPYILTTADWREKWLTGFRSALQVTLSVPALQYWGEAALAYRSQISTFWQDENDLRKDFEHLNRQGEGGNLWQRDGANLS